jgi:hypothetical protein
MSAPPPNRYDNHYAYTALFPVAGKEGGGPLRVHLNGLDAHRFGSPFSRSKIIHLLRFIVIDRLPYEAYPNRTEGLGSPYLVMMCDFDGKDVMELADSLATDAADAVCDVFGRCVAFPITQPSELATMAGKDKLADYLRKGQVETVLYLSDQPGATVKDILRAVPVQAAFADFVANYPNVDPSLLKEKFFELWDQLEAADTPPPGSL